MKTLKELAVDHPYYCSDSNYYSNDAYAEHNSWEEYYEEMCNADMDYNLIFRWDIKLKYEDDPNSGYEMYIFNMQQRKGKFVPIYIKSIKEENVSQMLVYLQEHYEHLKKLWNPLN